VHNNVALSARFEFPINVILYPYLQHNYDIHSRYLLFRYPSHYYIRRHLPICRLNVRLRRRGVQTAAVLNMRGKKDRQNVNRSSTIYVLYFS